MPSISESEYSRLGAKRTDELAVMLDTFHPLHVARDATSVEDPEYGQSWLQQ